MCFKLPMERYVLTDAQWAKMAPHCLGKPGDPGRSGVNNRRFVEAVLWNVRPGAAWRDLPAVFGNWEKVVNRFLHWVKAEAVVRLFGACSGEPDMGYALI